uniref:leukemia inhibitory factor receptor-like n=1 Tax=Monopterus albus TaxID=43700 RepID=UPI0009B4B510|nr:leukemia inhibitory factor receptor-like [Monopterus albus]
MIMITWLLLVSLFCKSTQDPNGQETCVLHCGPQNLTLSTSNQMILLTWEDDPSCFAVHDVLIYELLVLRADKQVHYDEVAVMPDQIGSTHFWNWSSHLSLECTSHSVRLRTRHKNYTSPWKQEHIAPRKDNSEKPMVYPQDRVFKVGSRVTFCCVLPAGDVLDKMYLTGSNNVNMNTTKISNQTYALTVYLNQPSKASCTDVRCESKTSDSGACVYIGYPPGDKDLQCETRDLESVECHWTVWRSTHLPKLATAYQLLGSPCVDGFNGRCLHKVQVDAGERNWTLTAENRLGKLELSDRADMTKRVHMFAPERVAASTVNARNVSLEWGWPVQQYRNLKITCQINVSYDGTNIINEYFGVGINLAVLNDLIPNWTYNVTVRCATQHFWKWSDWSSTVKFHTKGDVPDALDVWMKMKGNQTTIIWKVKSLFSATTSVNSSWIIGNNGSFSLSWSASPKASCGYIVDWCPTSGHCVVDWLRVPSYETNAVIFSKNFKDGVRYSLSIFACTQGAPVLLERREGYVKEERIQDGLFKTLKWQQQDSDVEISWAPIFLNEQTAFIHGYILYWSENNNNNKILNVSTGNLTATSLTARNLIISSYTFRVNAQTAVGECGTASISVTLNSLTDNLIKAVFISVVTVFIVLALLTVVCYRHWTCIKQKVYPTIPKPELTDKWLTSPGKHSCHHLCMDQQHTEADIMDVPELYFKSGAPVNSQANKPFVFAQTPKGYYNQPHRKCSPPPFILPTKVTPAELGLPLSPLKGVFPNLSYNLIMQTGDQQSKFGPEIHEGTCLERSSSAYQPQSHTEAFTLNQREEAPESPMSCVSTYILLPQSPSKQ